MASQCSKCGDEKHYNFRLNIGLCDVCILNRLEQMETALERIRQWAKAYPLDVFPEPDFKAVREALKAYNISLDAVSASNMRHVLKSVSDIVEQGLKGE